MPKMLQIRHVPDDVHRRLKARAALAGLTLSDFALAELRPSLDRPTNDELVAMFESIPEQTLETSPTAIIREDRDRRAGD
jgi:antitoxin FitA